jgi:hypothetical protein
MSSEKGQTRQENLSPREIIQRARELLHWLRVDTTKYTDKDVLRLGEDHLLEPIKLVDLFFIVHNQVATELGLRSKIDLQYILDMAASIQNFAEYLENESARALLEIGVTLRLPEEGMIELYKAIQPTDYDDSVEKNLVSENEELNNARFIRLFAWLLRQESMTDLPELIRRELRARDAMNISTLPIKDVIVLAAYKHVETAEVHRKKEVSRAAFTVTRNRHELEADNLQRIRAALTVMANGL